MAQVKFLTVDTNGIYVDHDATSADLTLNSVKTGTGAAADAGGISLSGGLKMNNTKITGLALPTISSDGATKGYVDDKVTGLDVKDSTKYVSILNITDFTTSGTVEAALDPVSASSPSLVTGDRVLVKAQSTLSENGLYEFDGSDLIRSDDADVNAEVTPGLFTFVEQGDTLADTGWVLSSDGPIVVDTSDIVFTQFSSAGQVVGGGAFVTRNGNVIEFTELTDQNVVIGNATDDPTKVTTVGAGVSGSGGSNQISATTTSALVIKAGMIIDDQVSASANIQDTKLQVNAGHAPAAASTAPVAVAVADLVSTSIEKLQQHLSALGDTTAGVGAALVSIENLGIPSLSATTVQDALDELKGEDFTVGTGGVSAGDVVYSSGNNEVVEYATITALQFPIGIAAETKIATETTKVISNGVISGLAGLVAGTRYYWDGSALVTALPAAPGSYIFQIGTAVSTTELLVDIDLLRRNTP